jgi:hypothetical protein
MATPHLKLVSGSVSATIASGSTATNYMLEYDRWAPSIAGMRKSPFGGVSLYNDVEEEMTLHIKGATAAAAYSNLATISRLMDIADRWSNGENVSPVFIEYAPQGSTVSSDSAPLKAIILGRASGDESSGTQLDVQFNEAGNYFVIKNVRIRFWRRGVWCLATPVSSNSSTSNGRTVLAPTISAAYDPYAAYKLTLAPQANIQAFTSGFVLTSEAEIASITSADFNSASARFSTVAESSSNRPADTGNNVWRFTPNSTNYETFYQDTGLATNCREADVFVVLRMNTSNDITLYAEARAGATPIPNTATTPITITAGTTTPQIVYLGTITSRDANFTIVNIYVKSSTASGAATVDFDTVVLVSKASRNGAIALSTTAVESANVASIIVDGGILSSQTPNVTLTRSSVTISLDYRGNAFLDIYSDGTAIYILYLSVSGSAWMRGSGTSRETIRATVDVYPTYITPQ